LAKVAMTRKRSGRNAVGISPEGIADDDRFLNALQVRARYGDVSEMTLWRWVNERSGVGFPQPTKLANGRNFWRLSQLRAWEHSREAVPKAQQRVKNGRQ